MNYDLIIIGSGPGGYVAAIRAGQTGLKTLVIDEKYIGGMCLNWGCIPTKSILESARLLRRVTKAERFGIDGIEPEKLSFNWTKARTKMEQNVSKLTKGIEYLWKKNGVEFLRARAELLSPTSVKADKQILEARHIIIATGSKPAPVRFFKDSDLIEIEQFFISETLPIKPLIYGRGAYVAELAQFFSMIGHQPTVLLEASPILPQDNDWLNTALERILKKEKIPVFVQDQVQIEDGAIIQKDRKISFDKVINCSLRKATLPPLGFDLQTEGGYIKVDDHLQSSIPSIYAIGDVNGKSFLAHSASAQGLHAVNHIQGNNDSYDDSLLPMNIYTEPEIAMLGKTEEQLTREGIDFKSSEFGLNANGKAIIEGDVEGSVRLLYETKYNQVLGVQIIGHHATDMIAEAGILMQLEGTVFDLARTIHAHPTIPEVFMEAGILGANHS
ncbi:MAG: FAD-dependent oxidoreductase [Candidatus Cloacimonetes bacterium]|nr:FAD-dependent oxidoreductase [Candidatus Cloacimonadota bacterium]